MQELVPYVSCLVNPHEFDEALKSTYSEIFVAAPDGYYKHMKLRGGRHIRLKVDTLPKTAKLPDLKDIGEELNFLPAGKVPYEYLEQIVHFFKEVMRLKKADYEAHAWVLWSKDKGYYISVPKQTVSKAAVQFSYDEEALPPDSIIVVDIHSHNTMGAFFSGTDNNNDKNGVYYSGVVGKLDNATPQIVFRFNMHDTKMECKIADIFDIPKKEISIPSEWMDQVEVKAVTTPKASTTGIFGGPNGRRQPSLWDSMVHDVTKNPDAYRKALNESLESHPYGNEIQQLMDEQIRELNEQAEAHIASMMGEEGTIYVPSGHEASSEEDEDPVGGQSDEYAYNKKQYGVDAAEAKDSIDMDLGELEGCDELLVDVIRAAYSMLGDEGRTDLSTNGM